MSAEPVEDCVQNTLSALYPPFTATGPTLLCQVFAVVERTYGEDALRYAIEFLVPAKHILQRIQQEACSQYSGFLFCHEGWPLCLHEKVVVQLSSLPWQCLKPGDFYLQVLPYLECSPRLALKCLAQDGRSIQEVLVPEDSYPFIFTVEWLNGINKDRHASRLENCLLAAGERVLRVPWSEVVYPQFVHKDGFIVGRRCHIDPLPLLTSDERFSEILGDRSPGDGRMSNPDAKDLLGGLVKEAVESHGNGGCGFAENIEGEYVELLDLSLSPGLGVDSRQKYLEANGISKTKTIPVRKGHGKGRNKRHRAWLHQKLPKEDASLNKNPGHRTWEGSRTGNDAAGVHSKQDEGQQKHVHSTQGTYYDAILCGQTNVDLTGTGRSLLAAAPHDSSLMEAKMPSAFVLDLHAEMVCWEADVHSSPMQELEDFTLHTPKYSPGIKKHTIEGNYVDSFSLGDSLGPSSESVHTATDGKLSSPEPVCIDCKLSPSEYTTTDGKLPSEDGESEPNTNCRHSPRPKEVLGTCLQGQCSTKQSDNETSVKLHQSASTTQETPSATTDLCVLGRMTEGTVNEDPPAGETDKRETCVSHIKGYPEEPSSSQEHQTIHHEREQKECRDGNEEQNKPTSQPPSNTLENAIDRETMHAGKIGSPGSACHAAPRKHGKGKRKRKKGGGKTYPKPQETQKAYMDMVGATEVPSEECPAPMKEELGPNAELEKPPESPEAGSQSEDALDEIGSDGDYIERRPEVVTKEKEGATGEQPDLESPALDKDTSIPPTSADFSNQSEDSLLLTSCTVDVAIPLVLPCQDHLCPGGEVTRQEVNWDVLQSGVFSLSGGVSLNGRALLIVAPQMTDSMYHSLCDQRDLLNVLSHLRSLLRKQMQDLGLAVIMDLRSPGASQPPQEILFQALRELQETFPQSINFTLILTENTEAGPSTDEVATLKPVVLSGLDDLKDHVCVEQLPPSLGGTLPYSHSEWMQNHRTLDSLTQLCMEVVQSLLDVIEDLKLEVPTGTSQEIQALISKQQETMMKVLSDGRLSELQRNGGALIARLQKSCNHRMDVASAFDLYDEVDNTIHHLVQLSNQRLHSLEVHLEQCLKQEEVEEAVAWISGSGEKMLAGYSELGDSVTVLQQIQETFLGFQALAKEKIRRGRDALGQVDSLETFTVQNRQRFQTTIEDFLQALEKKEKEIQKTISLQEFFQRAHKWTLEGVKRLAAISDRSGSAKQNQDVLASLAQYQQQHPVIPEKLFQKMKALALELQSQKALREWTQCWSKCQEMEKIFHKKMEVALKDKKALEKDQFSHESFNGRKTSAPEKNELSPEALKCKKPIFIDKGQLSPKVLKSKKGNSEKTEPSTEIPKGKKITGKEKGQLSPDASKGKNVSVTEEAQQRSEALKVKKPTSPGKLQTNQDALKVKKTASPDKVPSGSDGHRKRSDSISAVMEKGEGRRFWGLGSMLSPSRSMTSLLIPQASSSGSSHQEAPSFKPLAHSGVLAEDSDWDQVFVESERYEGSRVGLGSTASRAPTLPVCEKVSQDSRSRSPMSEGTTSPCLKPRVVSPKGLLLKKSQSTVSPPSKGQRSFSEPIPGQGKVGVYIRGLEVSSTEVVDRTCSPKEHVMIGRGGALSADAPWGGTPRMERKRRIGNLQRLMSEAIGCEQEYVTALGLLLEVLALELEKRELLAEQRQEFGDLLSNVEKLHAFHSGYFLQELEGCLSHPLRVATCFVRYADQISLYSLYVKNRHKIEHNLACNRSTFKPGQDDTDARLLQHLQRPLEQLEQYWRFLDEMVHECSQELVQERQSLCLAQELLLSQVHHGKNLMAVDSIKGFEVDLKEHGQLLLRDEFTIFSGRKKCQRHVFLFEHLLLFSKLKIIDAGLETYSYKQVFKTADMGLTENIGDSGLRFELWFRRRKNREAFTFQTGCVETKNRWTTVTAQLLWQQATDSKEHQSSEVVSIGPGNKSFLDIKASFGALSERTINALLMTRGSRTRASVAVSSFDHNGPCRQSSCPSTSPSTLALGPFNFQFPFLHSSTSPSSPGASSLAGSIAEEDWEYLACKTSPGAEPAGGVSRSVSQRDNRFAISIGKKTQNQSLFISQFGQGHQSTGKDQTSPNPSTSL